MSSEVFSSDVESTGRIGFLDANINAADPGAAHAHVRYEVATFIGDCDVHRLANLFCFLLCGRDHAARVFKTYHSFSLELNLQTFKKVKIQFQTELHETRIAGGRDISKICAGNIAA